MYSDDQGHPCLLPSFVVYLDALGTRDAMRSFDDAALRGQVKVLDHLFWHLHDPGWDDDLQQFVSFSDNVALAIPITRTDLSDLGLGLFMETVAHYQLSMTLRGQGVRGGITAGDVFAADNLIIGPALVEAVDLEEKTAVVPRILLSGLCEQLVQRNVQYENWSFWNAILLRDSDDHLFLNYLSVIDDDRFPGQAQRLIRQHKQIVLDGVSSTRRCERRRQKWEWVAELHNHFVRDRYPRSTTLLITEGVNQRVLRRRRFGPSVPD
jgi:hypothetical protein